MSEVSLLEIKSSAYLKDLLKNNGCTITSEGTAGVPTAFVAAYGTGEPRLGIMLEEGGTAVNVVPDRAVVLLTYRDVDRAQVEKGIAWIKDMVKGAGLATQTEGLAIDYFGLHDLLPNASAPKSAARR